MHYYTASQLSTSNFKGDDDGGRIVADIFSVELRCDVLYCVPPPRHPRKGILWLFEVNLGGVEAEGIHSICASVPTIAHHRHQFRIIVGLSVRRFYTLTASKVLFMVVELTMKRKALDSTLRNCHSSLFNTSFLAQPVLIDAFVFHIIQYQLMLPRNGLTFFFFLLGLEGM